MDRELVKINVRVFSDQERDIGAIAREISKGGKLDVSGVRRLILDKGLEIVKESMGKGEVVSEDHVFNEGDTIEVYNKTEDKVEMFRIETGKSLTKIKK